MVKTTLIYIRDGDKYLFLKRNKKPDDMNDGKYIGVGGHVEENETVLECLHREVKEETGLNLASNLFLGVIHFINTYFESEDIFMYEGILEDGTLCECDEGTFEWVNKTDIMNLELWEGDKYFLPFLWQNVNDSTFEITLFYDKYKLVEVSNTIYHKR